MKKLLFFILLLCSINVFGQPIVNRAGQANTVQDARLSALYNFFLPKYADTAAANLQLGVDSLGAKIFCYNVMSEFLRAKNQNGTKFWMQVSGSGNAPGGGANWIVSGNGQTLSNSLGTGGIGSANNYTLSLITNGQIRAVVPSAGFQRQSATGLYKYMLWDTVNHTWGYGDGGGTSSLSFTNGLTESGGTVKLGGTLTESTQIDGNNFDLQFVSLGDAQIISSSDFLLQGQTTVLASTGKLTLSSSSDSIEIEPPLGQIYIDTLQATDTTQYIVGYRSNGQLVKTLKSSLGGYWTGVGNDIYNNNSGNVGIGLSSPAFKLDVGGTSSVSDRKIGINNVQVIYLPDQATMPGNLFFGTSGVNASAGLGYNTGAGIHAFDSLQDGFYNTAFGGYALNKVTTGDENSAFGLGALRDNTTGEFNSAFGTSALLNNTSGQTNSAFGDQALRSNTTGLQNSAVGYRTLQSNIDGYFNTAMAYRAMEDNTSGYGNSAFGLHAVSNNTTGYYNSGFGMYSMDGITTGRGNTGLGYFAGNNVSQKVDAINSVALGSYSYTTADNQLRLSDSLTRITIPALPSNVGTKAVRYNPSTGDLSYADTTTGGGSTSPAGNFGNLQINRNGSFATAASDSLDYESSTGLSIKNGINITGNGTPLNMYNAAGATTVNKITWGTNYGATALELYNGGAGDRWGWGLPIGNMQFFIPNSAKFSVNKGGDLQASGTNEMFAVDANNSKIFVNHRFEQKQGADVASTAGVMTLGGDGNVFEITGTNSITAILSTNWQNGSEVTLVFTSTATLVDGTANSGSDIGFELDGNTNFVAAAGNVVTLVLSELGGTQRWRMKSKSLN